MAEKSVAGVVETLKASGLAESFLDVELSVTLHSGVYHSGSRWCRASRVYSTNRTQAKTMSLKDLASKDACTSCIHDELSNTWYSWNQTWELQTVVATYAGSNVLPRIRRLEERFTSGKGRKPAVGLTSKLLEEGNRAKTAMENLRQTHRLTMDSATQEVLENLEEALGNALADLKRASRSDRSQSTLLEKVRLELVPHGWDGELPEQDETPTLIAVSPPYQGGSRRLREVLSAFTVHESKEGQLVQGPRFVYDYLQRAFTSGAWHRTLLQAVPDPGDEVLETIAGVWNPADPGPLRQLRRAVETARILAGEEC